MNQDEYGEIINGEETYKECVNKFKAKWMHRTEKLDTFFARLFQEHRSNQHIHFIEWEDRINCVVEDGIYISQTNFFMTKDEFAKF